MLEIDYILKKKFLGLEAGVRFKPTTQDSSIYTPENNNKVRVELSLIESNQEWFQPAESLDYERGYQDGLRDARKRHRADYLSSYKKAEKNGFTRGYTAALQAINEEMELEEERKKIAVPGQVKISSAKYTTEDKPERLSETNNLKNSNAQVRSTRI